MISVLSDRLREERARVKDAWLTRLRAHPGCGPRDRLDDLGQVADDLLDVLADALPSAREGIASPGCRDVVKEFALLGGWLASRGATPTLMSTLVPALGGALSACGIGAAPDQSLDRLLEGLRDTVAELFCRSLADAAQAREEALLARSTPIVTLPGDVATLLVVGRPPRHVLAELLGRLLLTVARTGAEVVWVDLGHGGKLSPEALGLIPGLAEHPAMTRRTILVTVPDDDQREALAPQLAPLLTFVLLSQWSEGLAWLQRRDRARPPA
jgi:hypothetical protein